MAKSFEPEDRPRLIDKIIADSQPVRSREARARAELEPGLRSDSGPICRLTPTR